MGWGGRGHVLLVALALVHGLGIGGGIDLLGGHLYRGPLLHNARVVKWVQVDVTDEVSQRVLHKALGNFRLAEEFIDSIEHGNSNQSAANNLSLCLTD